MDRSALFDCTIAWSPRDLLGPDPYVIYVDERSEPFAEEFIRAIRGEDGFRGVISSPSEAPDDAVVVCEMPVWHRGCEELRAAGIRGERALAMLYFDHDPSGFWDFAKACGKGLSEIFRDGGVDAESIWSVSDFLEQYVGGRISNGRLVPMREYYTRDYLPLQQAKGAEIARVMAAMADDESRSAYARILFGTAEQVFTEFSRIVFGPQQYMEIVEPKPGDVIINCGVARGWEIPYFLCRMKGEGQIHNIDPTIQYLTAPFAEFITSFSEMTQDHKIIAGDKDGTVELASIDSGMVVSDSERQVSAGELVSYESRTIDSLMADGLADRLDFLKMDVEGGERAILRGAMETIRKHRPKLAVAIYHEPHHFWEYPNYLLDNLEDYRFYLRQYGYSRFETLLYAVPAEAVVTTSGEERLRRAPRTELTSERPGRPLVLTYFRDAPGLGRNVYNGNRRVANRLFGVDWETAEIKPGPRVEADSVCGAIEAANTSVFMTRHDFGDRHAIIIGRGHSPMEIEWVANIGLSENAACIVVDSDDPTIRFILHEADTGAASMHVFDGVNLSHERSFHAERPIVAAWGGRGEITLLCRSDDGAMFLGESAEGEEAANVESIEFPEGDFQGLVTLKRNAEGGPSYTRGFAVRNDEEMSIYEVVEGSFEVAATLKWDERFVVIPTFVSPAELAEA